MSHQVIAEQAGPRVLADRWAVVAWSEAAPTQSTVEEWRARGAAALAVSIARLSEGLSVDHVLCVWGEGDDASAAMAMARICLDSAAVSLAGMMGTLASEMYLAS